VTDFALTFDRVCYVMLPLACLSFSFSSALNCLNFAPIEVTSGTISGSLTIGLLFVSLLSFLRRRQRENSLLRADRVASPIFDFVAGNSLLSAEKVLSPILDFSFGLSSLTSGRTCLLSCDKVVSPIGFRCG
jgi:hypothetical protein